MIDNKSLEVIAKCKFIGQQQIRITEIESRSDFENA
jgi:hypothetical protein